MPNPYYNSMNQAPMMNNRLNQTMNMVNEAKRFMNNPMQYIMQRNINMPQGAIQNPYKTIQNMLNSGQMTQGQLNNYVAQARQIMSMMGR